MKKTTIDIRDMVINHYNNGKWYGESTIIINRSRSTVQYIIARYKNGNRVANKAKK